MRLELSTDEHVFEDGDDEPSLFFIDIRAKLLDGELDDEVVGEATACIFQHDEANGRPVSLFDVGDCIDQETHDVWCAVMDQEQGVVREELSTCCVSENILYIKTMQIAASHRRRGLGLYLMRRIMNRFSAHSAIAVIEPHPLNIKTVPENEWRTKMEWTKFGATKAGALKLRNYWKQLGFKPVPGSKQRFFYFNLENELPAEIAYSVPEPLEDGDDDDYPEEVSSPNSTDGNDPHVAE